MGLIALPNGGITVKFKRAGFQLMRADAITEYFNGATAITVGQKSVWGVSFNLPPTADDATAASWRAALVDLAEQSNWFEMKPLGYTGPATGYSANDAVVNLASQTGFSLNIDGMSASTAIALRGDYLSFTNSGGDKECKMLDADLTTNGSGEATATFRQQIRKSPADAAAVELTSPVANFMMKTSVADWSVDEIKLHGFAVDATESFGP